LYGSTFLFANWGPNTTTFVVPAELFPTRARGTAHGLAAAAGKVGAVVGTWVIRSLLSIFIDSPDGKRRGVAVAMYFCSAVAAIGALVTWTMMRETKHQELEQLESVDAVEPSAFSDTSALADATDHGVDVRRIALAGEQATFASDL
jgi:PHS family inorganic phosphate transporter-like MFS transporter